MLEESSRQPQLPPALCGPFASKDALKAALVLHDPQRRSLRTVIGQSNKHRVAYTAVTSARFLFSLLPPLVPCLTPCMQFFVNATSRNAGDGTAWFINSFDLAHNCEPVGPTRLRAMAARVAGAALLIAGGRYFPLDRDGGSTDHFKDHRHPHQFSASTRAGQFHVGHG